MLYSFYLVNTVLYVFACRSHAHAVERSEGQAPAAVRVDAGRVHAHGGEVDRERPAVRARRRSEAPVVPQSILT